jgi:CAAX protease family protein
VRTWGAGATITAAALLVAAPLTAWWTAVVAVGFAVALVAARRSPGALRATLVAAVVAAIFHGWSRLDGSGAIGTALVCLVVLAAWPVFARVPALRPAGTWLTAGRFTASVWLLLAVLIVVSAAALTVWTALTDPPAPVFLADAATRPAWLTVLGVLGFSLVNGIWEEGLYRGILQTELTAALGARPAIVIQAVAFGIAHLNGFPSGWVGAVLAGFWGLLLGVLRHHSTGMLAPYVAHIAADATIATLSLALLT